MTEPRNPSVSARKTPRQARATALIEAVLDAAVQVLRSEGAARFTTARVAERAGVSVGSLYQYFPNKASILFRLQAGEWRRTADLLRTILTAPGVTAPQRLRRAVHAFLTSECDEAQIRLALGDAAPLYRDAPEADEAREDGSRIFQIFVDEALPARRPGPPPARCRPDRTDADAGRQQLFADRTVARRDRRLCRRDGGRVRRLSGGTGNLS